MISDTENLIYLLVIGISSFLVGKMSIHVTFYFSFLLVTLPMAVYYIVTHCTFVPRPIPSLICKTHYTIAPRFPSIPRQAQNNILYIVCLKVSVNETIKNKNYSNKKICEI